MKIGDRVHAYCTETDIEGTVIAGHDTDTGHWSTLQGKEIDADSVVLLTDIDGDKVRINGWLWTFEGIEQ